MVLWRTHGWNEFRHNFFTPGLLFFVLAAAGLLYISKPMQFVTYDEFSHWAVVVKNTYLYQGFSYKFADLTRHVTYPPGLALLSYFTLALYGQFSAGIAIYGVSLFILCGLTAVMYRQNWRTPVSNLLLSMVLLLLPLAFRPISEETNYAFTGVYAELPMAIGWGYLMLIVFVFYRKNLLLSVLLLLTVPVFCLLKKNCTVIVFLIGVQYLMLAIIPWFFRRRIFKRKSGFIKRVGGAIPVCAALICGYLAQLSWTAIMQSHQLNGRFDNMRSLSVIGEWFYNNPAYDFCGIIIERVVNHFIIMPEINAGIVTLSIFTLLVLLSGGVGTIGWLRNDGRLKILSFFILFGGIIYMVQLGLGYMLLPDFALGRNMILTSWGRYIIVPVTAFAYIALAAVWIWSRSKKAKATVILVVICQTPIFLPYLNWMWSEVESHNQIYYADMIAAKQALEFADTAKMVAIGQDLTMTRDKHPRPYQLVLHYLTNNPKIGFVDCRRPPDEAARRLIVGADVLYVGDADIRNIADSTTSIKPLRPHQLYRKELPGLFRPLPLPQAVLDFVFCNPLTPAASSRCLVKRVLKPGLLNGAGLEVFLPKDGAAWFSWHNVPQAGWGEVYQLTIDVASCHGNGELQIWDDKQQHMLTAQTINASTLPQKIVLTVNPLDLQQSNLKITGDDNLKIVIEQIVIHFAPNKPQTVNGEVKLAANQTELSNKKQCYSGFFSMEGDCKLSMTAKIANTGAEPIKVGAFYMPFSRRHNPIMPYMLGNPLAEWRLNRDLMTLDERIVKLPENIDGGDMAGRIMGFYCSSDGESLPADDIVLAKVERYSPEQHTLTLDKPLIEKENGLMQVFVPDRGRLIAGELELKPGETGVLRCAVDGVSDNWQNGYWPQSGKMAEFMLAIINNGEQLQAKVLSWKFEKSY